MDGREDGAATGGDLAMPAAVDDDDDITDSDAEGKDDGEAHYACAQTETRRHTARVLERGRRLS